MSRINGILSDDWIEENHPNNGVFRVYWKDVITTNWGGATLNPDEGEGLRYEWEYKDGKRADGVSKSWYSSGQLKEERTYKNEKRHGSYTFFYENGQKESEKTYKDGRQDGLATKWYENGQKKREYIYKDGTRITKKVWSKDGKQRW